MSSSGAELLRQVKSKIDEVDPAEVKELIDEGVTIVDVRGSEEFATGHLPGAKSIPRGHLESRIEDAAPDRSAELILYCAVRPPLGLCGAHAAGGPRLRARALDDRRDHALEGPRLRGRGPARPERRAARPLLAPPADPRDRRRGPAEAARRQGAAARRRRPRLADGPLPRRGRASARSASSTTTSSTSRTSSAR